ncbi:uncharacterized protein BJ171DRAFT_199610 [Polychytrium aggregatum]|uniref:uncharacterized protein n=1 Tax=Polychytrium aggregatum TaxID=110093 RepID=UPI0022FE8685|nr:uncharacterized protein BJ171DRAFT_199610 [Polychytrium aggregatum]KAI9199878.1 hypothetical protein BJ171DRAFT_199610 [Polychytrium aggregatum]
MKYAVNFISVVLVVGFSQMYSWLCKQNNTSTHSTTLSLDLGALGGLGCGSESVTLSGGAFTHDANDDLWGGEKPVENIDAIESEKDRTGCCGSEAHLADGIRIDGLASVRDRHEGTHDPGEFLGLLGIGGLLLGGDKSSTSEWGSDHATRRHRGHAKTCRNSGSSSRTSWSCGCSDPHSPLRGSGGDGSTRQSPPCRTWSTAECNPTCRWHRGIDGCSLVWCSGHCI